jgi:monoamine oxidase
VIEARNRIGGRIISFSDFVPGKVVEGGGELIGSNHPAWVSYKEKFKLDFLPVTEEDLELPDRLNGRRLSAQQAEELWEHTDAAFNLLNPQASTIADAERPWASPGADLLDRRTLASWIDSLDVSAECKAGMHALMTADSGVSTAWQSLLAVLAMVKGGGVERFWTESEVFRCKGGNQQLAFKLAGPLGDRVVLRSPVTRILVKDQGVSVTLATGKVLEGDDVVVTAPPWVWSKIAFEPALPAGLIPQRGSNVKFLISLNSAFWRRAGIAPTLLGDGPVHLTWHQTDGQRGPGESFVAFSGGPAADTCSEWPSTQRIENYLKELEAVYRGIRPSFVKSRFMDWPNDPWAKASYSFAAPGQVVEQGPTWREGIGRLHFAGEYTSYAFPGYMEGALSSGVAVARRLAEKDGLAKVA